MSEEEVGTAADLTLKTCDLKSDSVENSLVILLLFNNV